jgi:hypothetical protein
MGRPLNKKYYGKRNPGATGAFGALSTPSDYDLGGTRVTGATVGTVGSFATTTIGGTVTVAANGALSGFTSTTVALPAGTQVIVSGGSNAYIAAGTYYVAATPAATTTTLSLVTTQGGSTYVTTTAGNSDRTFSYTQFASYTFPAPVLGTEGATTAVGTPTYYVVSGSVATTTAGTGSAYRVGDTLTSNTAVGTVVGLAATATISSVTIANTTGSLTVTSGTYYKGQSIYLSGALTNGSITGYNGTAGTYYISSASGTSLTTINITDTYANAIAGTNNLTTVLNASAIAATATLGGGAPTATASVTISGTSTLTVPAGSYYVGEPIIVGGSLSGATGTGLTAATYYIFAPTSTTIGLASTFANALAGTGIGGLGNGTTTGLTFIIGGGTGAANIMATGTSSLYYNPTTAVLPAALVTSTQTPTNSGSGSGQTVQYVYGLLNATMTNNGNGYLSNTVGTTYITATTTTASVSSVTSTISNGVLTVTAVTGTIANGMILTGGSVTAGTYIQYQLTSTASAVVSPTFSSGGQAGTNTITLSAGTSVAVGQIVTGTGLSSGTTVTAISGANATLSNYFTQQAAGTYNFYAYGGNGTYQLGINSTTTGQPLTANSTNISNAGAPTAASVDVVTVTSTTDISAGMRFTPARTFGNLTGGTTYFIFAVLSSTTFTVSGTLGATSATAMSTTAAPTLSSPVIAASGAITFTSITTALAAGTPVVVSGTNSGGGTIANGTYYVAASPAPSATGMTLVTTPNGTTVATTTAGTPTGLTFTFYPAAPFGQYNVITVGGTGTSSPAATITLQAQVTTGYVGMYPAIQAVAITVGEVARSNSDIIKQENTQRFKVENQDGVAYCKLITSYPTGPGQMAIQATDSTGNLYWASRITNRQCVVTRQGTAGQFTSGQRVNWVLGTAVLNTSVKIDNA